MSSPKNNMTAMSMQAHVARAKAMSKIERRLDAPDRRLLERVADVWSAEETLALIKRRAPPLAKLSRGQSVARSIMLNALGNSNAILKERAVNFQERGVLPAVDLAGDNDSAWKLPGMSVVKDYISDAHARKRTFRTSTVLRSFPAGLTEPSAIEQYVEAKKQRARMNPYADVEPTFGSAKHDKMSKLPRDQRPAAKADPFWNMPYVDQDEAMAVSKKARRLRIRISQLGILQKVEEAEMKQQMERHATAVQKRLMRKQGVDDNFMISMVSSLFKQPHAWKKAAAQLTKLPPEYSKNKAADDEVVHIAPTPRRGHTLTLVDSLSAILFGGNVAGTGGQHYSSQTFRLIFHPLHWEQVETTGSRPLGRAFHTAILGEETKIVVHGGISRHGSNDDCYELDIVHNQWSVLFQYGEHRPAARHGHTMTETAQIGSTILFGGAGAGFYNDLFFFDARTGRWDLCETSGTPPAPRAFHSACALENKSKMVIFGGQNGSANLNDLHEFNIENRSWTFVRTQGVQPSPRWGHIAITHGMDSLIIFGGAGETFLGDMLMYNAFHATWKEVHGLGPCPQERWGHSCVIQEESSVLFFFGGCGKQAPYLGDTYQFTFEDMLLGPSPEQARRARESRHQQEQREGQQKTAQMLQDLSAAMHREKPAWSGPRKGNEWRWSAHGRRDKVSRVSMLSSLCPPPKTLV